MEKYIKSIAPATHKRTITILAILLIVITIPLTVVILRQQQDIRQRALEGWTFQTTPSVCPESSITFTWESVSGANRYLLYRNNLNSESLVCDTSETTCTDTTVTRRDTPYPYQLFAGTQGSITAIQSTGWTAVNFPICPVSSPTPIPTLTPAPSPISACSCSFPSCNNGICQCQGGCFGGQHCEYPQGSPSEAVCVADLPEIPDPTNTPASPTSSLLTLNFNFTLLGILGTSAPSLNKFQIIGPNGANIPYVENVAISNNKTISGRINILQGQIGNYALTIKPNGYLSKRHTFTATRLGNISVPSLSNNIFIIGDVNNDDTINALDYGAIVDCFESKNTGFSCNAHKNKGEVPDLNNDSIVNGVDYNAFLRNFGKTQI